MTCIFTITQMFSMSAVLSSILKVQSEDTGCPSSIWKVHSEDTGCPSSIWKGWDFRDDCTEFKLFLYNQGFLQLKTIFPECFLQFLCSINLPLGHVRFYTKSGPDWFRYLLDTNWQTPRQAKYIYRLKVRRLFA